MSIKVMSVGVGEAPRLYPPKPRKPKAAKKAKDKQCINANDALFDECSGDAEWGLTVSTVPDVASPSCGNCLPRHAACLAIGLRDGVILKGAPPDTVVKCVPIDGGLESITVPRSYIVTRSLDAIENFVEKELLRVTQPESYRGFSIELWREGNQWVSFHQPIDYETLITKAQDEGHATFLTDECAGIPGGSRKLFLKFVHKRIDYDIANWEKQFGKKWE
jgi:hypothetical protein